MAIVKQTIMHRIIIEMNDDGSFKGAVRIGEQRAVEDGTVIAERQVSQIRTLAQVKADVAAL